MRRGRFVFSENTTKEIPVKKKSLLDSDIRGSARAQQAMALAEAASRKTKANDNTTKQKKKSKRARMDDAIAARLLAQSLPKNPELRQKREIEERREAVARAVRNSASLLPKGPKEFNALPWRDEDEVPAEARMHRRPVARAFFYATQENQREDDSDDTVLLDPGLEARLRPHQIEGVFFVNGRLKNGAGGAMICDAMGLGKTATTLAALGVLMGLKGSARRPRHSSARCVIACPAGVANTWLKEAARWWQSSSVRIFADVGQGKIDTKLAKRRKRLDYVAKTLAKQHSTLDEEDDAVARFARCPLAAKPVLVISYEAYRSRSNRINSLHDIGFLVCDEAHRLKGGDNTEVFAVLDACPARRRILVTATPIQNGIDELENLLKLCDPLLMMEKQNCQDGIHKIQSVLRTLAIRRRVGDAPTLNLPLKTEIVLSCRPTQKQLNALQALVPKAVPDSSMKEDQSKASALRALNATCLACSSLGDPDTDLKDCGKWRSAIALLRYIRTTSKERVLLVSRFSAVLNAAMRFAEAQGWQAARIDGSTELDARDRIQTDLNAIDSKLFLVAVSLRAGGLGLTLTGASRLILFEPSWNPTEDDQAVARIWRFGQIRPVFIYKLITAFAIEEHVIERQRQKRSLAAGIRGHISASVSQSKGDSLDELIDEYDQTNAAVPPVTSLPIYTLLKCREDDGAGREPLDLRTLRHRDPLAASVPGLADNLTSFSFFSDDE